MGLLPAEQLFAAGVGKPHYCDAPVTRGSVPRCIASIDELLHEAADGGRGQLQPGTDVADPDPVGVVVTQALQNFDLGHRRRFPRVVTADPGAQRPPEPVDHLGELLGVTRKRLRRSRIRHGLTLRESTACRNVR